MKRSGYSYVTIHYVHDVISGECLNVGVALLSADGSNFQFRVPSSLVRVKSAFPDASVSGIRDSLNSIESNFRACLLSKQGAGLSEIFASILPEDEGSIRASKPGVGLTTELTKTADELLDRFVLRCDWGFDDAAVLENHEVRIHWNRVHLSNQVQPPCNDEVWEDLKPVAVA